MSNRESLDTNDEREAEARPTAAITDTNKHLVACAQCDGRYYVDDFTFEKVQRALAFDPTDNQFTCDRCEAENSEEARAT
jgi:hypothetical protein